MNKDERIQLMKIIDIRFNLILTDRTRCTLLDIYNKRNEEMGGYDIFTWGEIRKIDEQMDEMIIRHDKMVDAFINEKIYIPEQLNNQSVVG